MPPPLDAPFEQGVAHHRAGRPAEAEPIYRQILAADPGNVAAYHYLGLIAHQVGHPDGVVMMRRSLEVQPDSSIRSASGRSGRIPDGTAVPRRGGGCSSTPNRVAATRCSSCVTYRWPPPAPPGRGRCSCATRAASR